MWKNPTSSLKRLWCIFDVSHRLLSCLNLKNHCLNNSLQKEVEQRRLSASCCHPCPLTKTICVKLCSLKLTDHPELKCHYHITLWRRWKKYGTVPLKLQPSNDVCVSSDCDDETVHGAVRWQAKSCYDYPRGSGGGEESVGVCEVAACDWLSGRRAADCSGTWLRATRRANDPLSCTVGKLHSGTNGDIKNLSWNSTQISSAGAPSSLCITDNHTDDLAMKSHKLHLKILNGSKKNPFSLKFNTELSSYSDSQNDLNN